MRILPCEFNMDTACVELRYSDGTMISIDHTAARGSNKLLRAAFFSCLNRSDYFAVYEGTAPPPW